MYLLSMISELYYYSTNIFFPAEISSTLCSQMIIDSSQLFIFFGSILTFASIVCGFWLSYFKRSVSMASGTLKCQCGQVCGKFAAPKDSPSAACHCLDCIRFVDWTKYCKNCSLDVRL